MWRGQVGREMDESEARVRDMVAQREREGRLQVTKEIEAAASIVE